MHRHTWLAVAALVVAVASTAVAGPVDRDAAAELARAAAAGDAEAQAALLTVDEIGGAPVDLTSALTGATDSELRARLRTLAGLVLVPSADDAPELARRILAEARFSEADPSWWDRFWRRLVARFFAFLGNLASVPGGAVVLGGVALAAVVGLAAAVTTNLARRRARRVATETSLRRAMEAGLDPGRVERSADLAAEAGDWSEAVRLRFLAGLLRADREGLIRFAPGLTTHEVASALDSPAFDRLAAQFDEIVYGGRPAGPEDDAASRRGWAEVLGARSP